MPAPTVAFIETQALFLQTPSPVQTQLVAPQPTASLTSILPPTPALPPLPVLFATPTPSPAGLESLAEFSFQPWALITAVAWSADGSLLAAASGESVILIDAVVLAQRQALAVGVWADGLDFSPVDTNLLAIAGRDGMVQLWDAADGQLLAAWQAHQRGANSVDFSPDGSLLASSGNDGVLRLWDLSAWRQGIGEGGQIEMPLKAYMIGGTFGVRVARFSPDGSLLAATDGSIVRLRSTADQRLARTLSSSQAVFSLSFSPDGGRLAAGEMGAALRLWRLEDGQELALLARPGVSPNAYLWSVAADPQGKLLASGGSDGWIVLWDWESSDLRLAWQAHGRAVTSLAFDPQGVRLASGGLDAVLRLWQAQP